MSEEERECFLKWHHNENQRLLATGELYKLRKEMMKYCYDDCNVLAMAFCHFNESMVGELMCTKIKGIVPHQYTILVDFVTLPQLVIHWYVASSMPDKTLAVVPHGGYDGGKCGSLKENIWLSYMDKSHEEMEGPNFVPIGSRYCIGQTQKVVGCYHLNGF